MAIYLENLSHIYQFFLTTSRSFRLVLTVPFDDATVNIPRVPRYFKQPINTHFRQCSFHSLKRAKHRGNVFVVSLIAKVACENSTTGSAS